MFKKISITLVAVLALLFITAAALPLFFKDTIIAKVKQSINENIDAKVDFNDLDISLIRSFPDLGININQLTVIGIDSFSKDTLANIRKLRLDLNLMSVIRGETYQINGVNLTDPNIYLRVLKSGKANWDIAKADTVSTPEDTTSSAFKASLKAYEIENGSLVYDDASLNFFMELNGLNHRGSGDFTQDDFVLDTYSDIEKLSVVYGGIPYLNQARLKADLPLSINMPQMKFTLAENQQIQLNELILAITGSLAMPNDSDIVVDAKFDAQQSDLKNFLSMIPAVYSENFKDLQATGKFGFDGFAKGIYNEKSLPAFGLNLKIENGQMKYPSLPSAINQIRVEAHIQNKDGVPDHTEISVPAFHLAFGQVPLDGRLLVKTPVSDPYIDMALKGRLDLQQLTSIFPMKDVVLKGILDADVEAKGHKSAVDKGNYQAFYAAGEAVATNIVYEGKEVDKPVNIPSARMVFSPAKISLPVFVAKIGRSDFDANGSISNYLGYIFQKDQALSGNLNVKSKMIDVNELMGPEEESSSAADTSKLEVIEVPRNIDFKMAVTADRILYDTYDISNARGTLLVRNQTVTFQEMNMNMLDGKISMAGSYATTDPKNPKVDIDFGIENMSIQKAFSAFNTVKLFAPIAKFTEGNFTTKLKFSSDLGSDMMPVYSSIDASGFTNIIKAVLNGFEPLNKLAAGLKIDEMKKLELNDVLAKFKIEEGRLLVAPFNVKKKDILMNIQGSNGLDKSLDYQVGIDVPRKYLGKANDAANSLLAGLNSKAGTNVALSEMVKVNAIIGGTITKPTIKLSLPVSDTKDAAKDVVNQVVADKKAEFEGKAKEEVAKLTDKMNQQLQEKKDSVKSDVSKKVGEEVKNRLNNLFKKKE